MGELTLALVIHNHQPVGNFDFVFAEAAERAYDPMLRALERHPRVRLALHFSGPLLDWLAIHRPGDLERLQRLVAREQVELLTGAYYEPILVAIPDADKVGQVRKMTRFLGATFGCNPTGAWLAERVWEPHLPKPLAEVGVQFTLLDDTPFKMAGLEDGDLFGSYVTEEQGYSVQVFGNSTFLRYAVPFHPVESVMGWLRERASAHPGGVAVLGDDGEKFGLWPGTWDLCWGEQAWVERFFAALEASADWLETRPLGEVAAERPPLGRIYLPCASYEEMMHWALPARDFVALARVRRELEEQGRQDVLRFVKGGLWRAFLARYDEVNQLHKKMLWVSRKVHEMPEGEGRTKALEHVWAAQCNCGYWHGLFGGIYLFHIRVANYAHLIAAEELADRAARGQPNRHPARWALVERGDLDADGREEVIPNTDRQVLVFKPSLGGALVEWDWRERRYNLLNVLTRRREGYHEELVAAAAGGRLHLPGQEGPSGAVRVKEPDIHTRLVCDWYRRATLVDHFVHLETTLEAFSRAQYGEQGDFVGQPYAVAMSEEGDEQSVRFARDGAVWVEGSRVPVRVEKVVAARAGSSGLSVLYRVSGLDKGPVSVRFGVEVNWGIVGAEGGEGYLRMEERTRRLSESGEQRDVSNLAIGSRLPDLAGEVTLRLSLPAVVWHFPLETVSKSEVGYERVYQGTCVLLLWEVTLEPDRPWEAALAFELTALVP